MLTQNT